MRLIDRWMRRDAGYWEGMASGAAVLTTSYGTPDREGILPQLAGWAQQVYGSSSPVFSAILARMALFSEARLQLQALDDKHLFGNTSLAILEHPFGPDSDTGELLVRDEQDASLAGQSYTWAPPGEDRLVRLRPDWTTIISELVTVDGGGTYRRKIGYWTEPPKSLFGEGQGQFYPADEVAHWAPIPDPCATFRGMSWLTPIVRDITGDSGLTDYKIRYLENSASPNLLIKYAQKLHPGTVDAVRERMHARYGGVSNAFKTLVLDQGADITVIGNSLSQMDFSNVEAAGEQRILSASAVPGVLIGLEPLRGAGRGYQESMQKFANLWARPQWRSWCAAHAKLVNPPAGNRLWYDTSDIAALQDGELERGQAALVRGQALLTCRQAGATLESAVAFINSGDVTKLQRDPAAAAPGGNVQHMLPQQQPGATATPLPAGAQPRLPVGATSPGDGANGHPPAGPQLVSVRRSDDPGEDDDWEEGDDLDLDDLLADADAPLEDGDAERFNPYHAKAGSPGGGQFTSSSGASGGAKAKANGAAKGHATATAVAEHPDYGGHAAQARQLREKAAADRAEAHRLQEELHGLLRQMRASVAAHKKAAAAAKAAKAAAHGHPQSAHHHRKSAKHHHRKARSLHSRISALRTRIRGLLAEARQLDAKAARL